MEYNQDYLLENYFDSLCEMNDYFIELFNDERYLFGFIWENLYDGLDEMVFSEPKEEGERICEKKPLVRRAIRLYVERIMTDENRGEIEEFFENIRRYDNDSLRAKLWQYLIMKNMSQADLARESLLTKQTISKIINGEMEPRRHKLYAICFGLGLTLKEAEELLSFAGYTFNPTDSFDEVIVVALIQGNMSTYDVNILLEKCGFNTFLGTFEKEEKK